jgi:hypothetical protein
MMVMDRDEQGGKSALTSSIQLYGKGWLSGLIRWTNITLIQGAIQTHTDAQGASICHFCGNPPHTM